MKRKYTSEEIINIKFNTLTPIEECFKIESNGVKLRYWKCRCDCGNIVVRREQYLISKHRNFCCGQGCPLRQHFGPKHPLWKGYEDIHSNFLTGFKRHAADRNLPFEITVQDVWELYLKQDKKCALSGLPIEFSGQRATQKKYKENTVSLDRIDSSLGYTIDNIQLLHKDINQIKMDYGQEYFIWLCIKVADFCLENKCSGNEERSRLRGFVDKEMARYGRKLNPKRKIA